MLYGLLGVIIIIGIAVMPVIKLSIITIAYKLTSAAIEPIADSKITGLLEQLGDIFKLFLGVLCALSFMLIIGTTLVLKISNSGMMYRWGHFGDVTKNDLVYYIAKKLIYKGVQGGRSFFAPSPKWSR